MSEQITKCFLCNSITTHFSQSKNKFSWYNFDSGEGQTTKVCSKCYDRERRIKLKEGTFISYKQKIGLRQCSRCGTNNTQITMTKTGYPHRKWVSDGNGGYLCHNCTKRVKYIEQEHQYTLRRLRRSDPRKLWAQMCIGNHKRNGFTMTLTRHELAEMALNADTCPICDVKLEWGYLNGKKLRNGPSLDRTNNEIHISKHNTQIICQYCNRRKLDQTMKEFIDYCKYVAKKFS